jgi:4-hydroxythreonine-4-phosphate dehydrogenase
VPRYNDGNRAKATIPDVRLVAFAAMAIALVYAVAALPVICPWTVARDKPSKLVELLAVPLKDVAQYITKENILRKLQLMKESLKKDFGINKPRIAILGLNPHAGDEGLLGKEEEETIKPAIKEARNKDILCFGPYSADAFFARGQHEKFDAVLALYHDQGLIPFKSLAFGEGVNYTAGLSGVRTSPDHGVAFDIAGKGIADEASFRQALFTCVDIINARREYANQYQNPLKKISASVFRNVVDEKIKLDEG